jgi:hypothetical protein
MTEGVASLPDGPDDKDRLDDSPEKKETSAAPEKPELLRLVNAAWDIMTNIFH